MRQANDLRHLDDASLLCALRKLVAKRSRLDVELVAYIGEVDSRRLYLHQGCSSMFVFATSKLHLSESAAYKYIHVARSAQQYPLILELLREARMHLSGVLVVAPHLNEDNHRELLLASCHKSKRELEKLVAERFPKPCVPDRLRKLPGPAGLSAVTASQQQGPALAVEPSVECRSQQPLCSALPVREMAAVRSLGCESSAQGSALSSPARKAVVTPLAPAAYKVEFTADQQLRDDIERALELLGPRDLPRSKLSHVIGLAMRKLVEDLERRKLGAAKRPRPKPALSTTVRSQAEPQADRPSRSLEGRSRHIANHVKREVVARDGGRCTFVGVDGARCNERYGLEFHHTTPFARGGSSDSDGIVLLCRAHNAYMAELDFGEKHMKSFRRSRTQPSATARTRCASQAEKRLGSTGRPAQAAARRRDTSDVSSAP